MEKMKIQHAAGHPMCGALIENMVVSELLKNRFNRGKTDNLYFLRDQARTQLGVDTIPWKSIPYLEIE